MNKIWKILFLLSLVINTITAQQSSRTTMNLNGIWEFDQTTNAFPPKKFTRKIPVPGLVHLAEPKIEDYDKFFKRPDKGIKRTTQFV
jgi:beta-galactosidase